MACRPLCRSLHHPARSLLSTRCFSPYRFQSDSPQPTALLTGVLPSDFANVRPFSSAPQFFSRDKAEGQISDVAKEGCSSSSSAQELTENGSLDIPSPIDLLIDGFDTLNYLTGLPWWGTISVSAIILRALMLPLKVLQDRKLAEIRSQGPILQLERLARGLSQGKLLEECRQLRKRRQGVSSPSFLWILGPGICIQVPLVLTIVWSLRRMAVEQHLGFATGGILWFMDLTVPGEGLVGAVLPLLVAAVYFGNVHVLFRGQPIRKGLLGELEKAWRTFLKYSNFLTFWCICYAPQALQVFLVPHSIMTLAQTKLFSNEKFVTQVVGPRKNAAVKLPVASGDQDTTALRSYETLLKDAGSCFTSGKMSQAIKLLKNAIKKEPEKGEAYALLGLLYKTQKDWVNSAVYYKQAISKAETDDFKIAAYAGCGLALLKEGVVMECIETLRPIRSFQVPERPDSRHCYYASLVILGRALLEAGLKEESQEVVQLYKELGMDKSEVK
ncbi:hypothetical protein L7F22_006017 [Adiantum nelumboides]|nr:hypothetical protein [Adiantum nelumboides]